MNKEILGYYDNKETSCSTEKLTKIMSLIPNKNEGLALDVGCGNAYYSAYLCSRGYHYTGIDSSETLINEAQKKGINVIRGDIENNFIWDKLDNNYYDLIILSDVLEHVFDTDKLISKCYLKLKFDGVLIITIPNIAAFNTRLRLLIGERPLVIDCRSNIVNAGHIRAFDYSDIMNILTEHDMKVVKVLGHALHLPLITSLVLADIFPKLSTGFIIKIMKGVQK